MTSDAVWALVLGAALTLIATLVAQWSSLAYQTKRQREARKADFQRSTLLQIREELSELSTSLQRAFDLRHETKERTGEWKPAGHHPDIEAVRSVVNRLLALATGVEDKQLRLGVAVLAKHSFEAARAPTEKGTHEEWEKGNRAYADVVNSLGKELRRLP
jgi:biopolymer transport protein ExbB/TolQ